MYESAERTVVIHLTLFREQLVPEIAMTKISFTLGPWQTAEFQDVRKSLCSVDGEI